MELLVLELGFELWREVIDEGLVDDGDDVVPVCCGFGSANWNRSLSVW